MKFVYWISRVIIVLHLIVLALTALNDFISDRNYANFVLSIVNPIHIVTSNLFLIALLGFVYTLSSKKGVSNSSVNIAANRYSNVTLFILVGLGVLLLIGAIFLVSLMMMAG